MPAMTAPVTLYSRQDAARILRVPEKQIAAWQRAGLISANATEFSIRDLAGMRSLRDLREQRLTVRSIRSSVEAMQRIAGMADPLHEAAPVSRGTRLVFRHSGALLDPLTQQLAFDFDAPPRRELSLLKREPPREQVMRDQAKAQEFFQRAVQLEEKTETLAEAAALYLQVLELCPRHAAASINLGTILYNDRRFTEAEQRYRTAAEIDPDYALAFFDLGNVLDELRRLPEAIAAYTRAIQLVPQYADAHYNLALAYERTGERRRALRHWLCYVRLDPVGPWATHARMQARRTLATERLSIVTRGGKLA
ncbi:tetratricopeptide repeat protein [Terriglobus roseus DSM 18391]|uniref:Tetratricopeptide repeat protein n=1 Tax=Terriglobus roseus (strain DSM 18391 / NRRL B-41598 / KBS 63) TaxID=926566 RepID=I3ZCK0_TERRK|nr:tetratricopeptide repeat protein [Terriglobus roseus]AFL86968.1 tetratricopeptide repeat protein [Terriglobus roseus DSM 18391]